MKTLSAAAMAEIVAGTAIDIGAVEIFCDPPLRVWGGPWPWTIAGAEYLGVGDRGLVKTSAGTLGAAAGNTTLELSGVDPASLELLDADEIKSAPAILRRLIFNGAGNAMLDVQIATRGRIDQVLTEEVVGGQAVIRALIEGAARGLRRRGGRMRSDADQRLIDPVDGAKKRVGYAAQKQLYWGGQPPQQAGIALGGQGAMSGLTAMFIDKLR